jgi:hypothetical protein
MDYRHIPIWVPLQCNRVVSLWWWSSGAVVAVVGSSRHREKKERRENDEPRPVWTSLPITH